MKTVNIPDGIHHELKILSANKGVPIQELLEEIILKALSETEHDPPKKNELSKKNHDRKN